MNLGITTAAMKNVVSQTTDVTQTVARGRDRSGRRRVRLHHRRQGGGRQGRPSCKLPAKAKPGAQDFIAVVKSGKNQAAAKAFVAMVLSPAGQAKLQAAGFGKP